MSSDWLSAVAPAALDILAPGIGSAVGDTIGSATGLYDAGSGISSMVGGGLTGAGIGALTGKGKGALIGGLSGALTPLAMGMIGGQGIGDYLSNGQDVSLAEAQKAGLDSGLSKSEVGMTGNSSGGLSSLLGGGIGGNAGALKTLLPLMMAYGVYQQSKAKKNDAPPAYMNQTDTGMNKGLSQVRFTGRPMNRGYIGAPTGDLSRYGIDGGERSYYKNNSLNAAMGGRVGYAQGGPTEAPQIPAARPEHVGRTQGRYAPPSPMEISSGIQPQLGNYVSMPSAAIGQHPGIKAYAAGGSTSSSSGSSSSSASSHGGIGNTGMDWNGGIPSLPGMGSGNFSVPTPPNMNINPPSGMFNQGPMPGVGSSSSSSGSSSTGLSSSGGGVQGSMPNIPQNMIPPSMQPFINAGGQAINTALQNYPAIQQYFQNAMGSQPPAQGGGQNPNFDFGSNVQGLLDGVRNQYSQMFPHDPPLGGGFGGMGGAGPGPSSSGSTGTTNGSGSSQTTSGGTPATSTSSGSSSTSAGNGAGIPDIRTAGAGNSMPLASQMPYIPQVSAGGVAGPYKLAQGGMPPHAQDMPGQKPSRYVQGPGSGTSDDIPARLSNGEYVIDAGTVSMLGDGSSEEGARRLDTWREAIRKHKGQALAKGSFPPNAKQPHAYMKGAK